VPDVPISPATRRRWLPRLRRRRAAPIRWPDRA
jgi:hypothetical protein